MLTSLKLSNLWRVVRDVDLDRIRTDARTPFEILVVSEDPVLAERVRAGIGAVGEGRVHPYVAVVDVEHLRQHPVSPLLVVIASATPELSPGLTSADEQCIRANWPRLTLIVGPDTPEARARRVGEQARVVVDDPLVLPRAVLQTIMDLIEGDVRLAVASALPVFRPVVTDAIVDETAKANATFAVTTGIAETVPVLNVPLNLGDMVVLTKNQLIMGFKIALAAGRDGEPRSMLAEILGVIGGGILFRQIARQLVGLVPVAGLLPKVAIAYAGTYAMGRALSAWALHGAAVTPESVGRYAGDGMARGRELAQEVVSKAKRALPGGRRQRLGGWLPSRRDPE